MLKRWVSKRPLRLLSIVYVALSGTRGSYGSASGEGVTRGYRRGSRITGLLQRDNGLSQIVESQEGFTLSRHIPS